VSLGAFTTKKENTMQTEQDTIDLVSMAHIAMDVGTIEGSPASMTREEIERAYALAMIVAMINHLEFGERK
jgi:hypothetical protein|tara:strand:- start:733 stop:945 length:213 start_codon:yes stop_codon:yes gene_type:complete